MQWINNQIDATKPSAISIAEDLQQNAWLTYTTGSGGAGFDAQWDAAFVHPVKTAIETAWDSDRSMWNIYNALGIHYGNRTRQVIYVSSHDEVGNGKCRPPSAIDSSNPGSWYARKRATLGTGVLMTAPGIPMIFQGEEFLQSGWFDLDVANNYLSWGNVTTYSGILQMYKD
jgi:1,4-alpha-glucan branching enzyme